MVACYNSRMIEIVEVDWDWVKNELLAKERIGAAKGSSSSEEIVRSLDSSIEYARAEVEPCVIYEVKNISVSLPSSIEIDGRFVITSANLASSLKASKEAIFFLATIGPSLEKKATSSMHEGDPLNGYLLDRIGSMAVESLAEKFESKTRQKYARENKSVSMRFSPGYCDWKIEDQFILDKILDFSRAGVSLNQSCMMVPKKSISGIIGIGNESAYREIKTPCSVCELSDCSYRRNV